MGLFVRMLEKQKWERLIGVGHIKTPADTLQSELKTDSNNLSLWLVENDVDLTNAVLALAVARNKITRLDIFVTDQVDFEQRGLNTENTPKNGLSPYNSFNDNHYDLVNIDYEKLGILSQMIIDSVPNPKKVIRYGKGVIENILYQGYTEHKFDIEELSERLQEDIIKLIQKKNE